MEVGVATLVGIRWFLGGLLGHGVRPDDSTGGPFASYSIPTWCRTFSTSLVAVT
jgi:hypothetical protein